MVILYLCGTYLFLAGIRIAAFWNPKARAWVRGRQKWAEALKLRFSEKKGKTIWFHCASLGEFEQGRPVIEKIRSGYPEYTLLLTFFSPSGYEVKKDYPGADIIAYLPADTPANASRFLSIVNPSLAFFVKYDYWHFYLHALKKREVPVILISAIYREWQTFFRFYGGFWRNMLDTFRHIFLQDRYSMKLLTSLKPAAACSVAGDTRFDRVITIAEQAERYPAIARFCGECPVIVAGSTWLEDEEEWYHFANTQKQLRFIIAPHEINAQRIRELTTHFKSPILFSTWMAAFSKEHASTLSESHILIIDNFGMLSQLYQFGTICYIGGGFGGGGVHNILEAAVYGKPLIFGPVYDRYREAEDLLELGGAVTVDSAVKLESVLHGLLSDPAKIETMGKIAADYVKRESGATAKILSYIQENRLLTS